MTQVAARTWLPFVVFGLLGVIWGSNFIFMKWAADYFDANQIVFWRVFFGFVPIALYALLTGAMRLHHVRLIGHFFVMSLLATSLYFYGYAKGTSLLLSGIAGALSGAIPLFAFVMSLFFLPEEKASWRKILGIAIGFVGIVIIANPLGSNLAQTNLAGVFYMALGSLSVGSSFVYARKFLAHHPIAPVALATYQLGLALVSLAFFTDLSMPPAIWADNKTLLGLSIGLGLLGTGCAYIFYYYIVAKLGAVTASSATYIPPIVALAIGAGLGEPLGWGSFIATGLIFLGVFLLKSASAPASNHHASEGSN